MSRAIEKVWPKYSSQPLVVVNKPGGAGVVATEFVVRSKPDGYTLYLGYGSGHDIVMPHLQKMPYDPYKDLVAVARISVHSVVVVTGAKSEFNSAEGHDRVVQEGEQADHLLGVHEGRCAGHHRHRHREGGRSQHRDRAVRGGRRCRDGASRRSRDARRPDIRRRSCRTSRPAASSRWRWPCPSATRRCRISPPSRSLGINVSTWGSVKGIGAPAGTPKEVVDVS